LPAEKAPSSSTIETARTAAAPTPTQTPTTPSAVHTEIAEMMDFQEMLSWGLVQDPIPTEITVEMHVENTGRYFRAGIFDDLDDTTGGLDGVAEPDSLDDLCAFFGDL
jgi:hypothetical protein